jgi:hypothetical protein
MMHKPHSIFISHTLESHYTKPGMGGGSISLPMLPNTGGGEGGRNRRRRNHVACQTDVTELVVLGRLQTSLDSVRNELLQVTSELARAEQKLRHEMRHELEARLRDQEARCMERVSFMRKRTERHVGQVRAASRTRLGAAQLRHERRLESAQDFASKTMADLEQNVQQTVERTSVKEAAQDLLAEENRQLLSKLAELKAQRTDSGDVARLEAAVASRDRTISVLRQQLAGFARQRTVTNLLAAAPQAAEEAPASTAEGVPMVAGPPSQREPDAA